MKKVIISLLSIIFILSMISNVYAVTGNISSGASAATVIKGRTFTITLTGTSEKPIEGMGTKLEYDAEVLKLKSVAAASGYEKITSGNESEIAISITSGATAELSATLCTIEFEVLETTSKDKATVNFNNSSLVIPDEEDSSISRDLACSISPIEVSIKVDGTTAGSEDPDETEDPVETEDPEETPEETPKKDTTTKLPQTGIESTSLIAIVVLGVVSIVSYVSYRKYKNI